MSGENDAQSRSALTMDSTVDDRADATNQNVWLQVSPYARPTFGYSSSGKAVLTKLSISLRMCNAINLFPFHIY